MLWLIKQVFITLLSFGRCLATKCVSLSNETCMAGPTLLLLNPIELNYYPFMISLDRYSGNCKVVDNYLQKYVFLAKQKT